MLTQEKFNQLRASRSGDLQLFHQIGRELFEDWTRYLGAAHLPFKTNIENANSSYRTFYSPLTHNLFWGFVGFKGIFHTFLQKDAPPEVLATLFIGFAGTRIQPKRFRNGFHDFNYNSDANWRTLDWFTVEDPVEFPDSTYTHTPVALLPWPNTVPFSGNPVDLPAFLSSIIGVPITGQVTPNTPIPVWGRTGYNVRYSEPYPDILRFRLYHHDEELWNPQLKDAAMDIRLVAL